MSFDCVVRQTVPYHSHTIFIADIVGVELWTDAVASLVYFEGRYRHLEDARLAEVG